MSETARSGPDWVPAFTAFEALRKQYEATNFFQDEEVCWRAAHDAMLRRMQADQLPARAAKFSHIWDEPVPWPDETPEPDADGKMPVPYTFWTYFLESSPIAQDADWVAGDFKFELVERGGWGARCRGMVIALEVDASKLPKLPRAEASGMAQLSLPTPRGGGRSPANWWPDFAEELAVYVHENGVPEGQGHEGQSAMIDGIFARMTQRGKAEPGRGTVQQVVNAVLRRIRSTEN